MPSSSLWDALASVCFRDWVIALRWVLAPMLLLNVSAHFTPLRPREPPHERLHSEAIGSLMQHMPIVRRSVGSGSECGLEGGALGAATRVGEGGKGTK